MSGGDKLETLMRGETTRHESVGQIAERLKFCIGTTAKDGYDWFRLEISSGPRHFVNDHFFQEMAQEYILIFRWRC